MNLKGYVLEDTLKLSEKCKEIFKEKYLSYEIYRNKEESYGVFLLLDLPLGDVELGDFHLFARLCKIEPHLLGCKVLLQAQCCFQKMFTEDSYKIYTQGRNGRKK